MDTAVKPQGCTNLKLRQLMRRVAQHYDAEVGKTGLRGTQYSLLSYVVLGRSAAGGGADTALLQRAAGALLAGRRGTGKGLAGSLGIDDISVRPDSTSGAVVRVGKRFADNFYAAYERSLSGAMGTLFIFYDVSRRLTLRAEAGERTGIDLIFTFSFDGGGKK